MSNDVGSMLGRPKEEKTFAPDERWVLPKCLIGMEFEYEGVRQSVYENDPYLPTVWKNHEDNSLKDHGQEYVFHTPLFGQDAYRAIFELMTKAKENKFKCSRRAGIHVHLDVRDMDPAQLIGLIICYAILEPLLFRWIGDNRENSIFCVPFYRADESLIETIMVVQGIIKDDKNPGSKTTLSRAKNFARYAGLNLQALAKFGSIEFRHMRTTHDVQRVVDWINIIQSLKAATYKLPTSDGAIIRLATNTPTNAFLEYIFGEELAKKLWCAEAQTLIQTIGIPTARDLVLYGLTETEWDDLPFPNGTHAGFAAYLESPVKKIKIEGKLKQQALEDDDLVPPSLRYSTEQLAAYVKPKPIKIPKPNVQISTSATAMAGGLGSLSSGNLSGGAPGAWGGQPWAQNNPAYVQAGDGMYLELWPGKYEEATPGRVAAYMGKSGRVYWGVTATAAKEHEENGGIT